jgi:SPOR domain
MLHKAAVTLILLIAAAFAGTTSAQTQADIFTRLESRQPGQGSIHITQDVNIRNMVNLHLSQQKKINGIRGYRICIYLDSGQESNKKADLERAKFISRFEDIKSYKRFEYPYYKVYVGDFRTKSEAWRFLKLMENVYPDAFIREDLVAFPD